MSVQMNDANNGHEQKATVTMEHPEKINKRLYKSTKQNIKSQPMTKKKDKGRASALIFRICRWR